MKLEELLNVLIEDVAIVESSNFSDYYNDGICIAKGFAPSLVGSKKLDNEILEREVIVCSTDITHKNSMRIVIR